MLPGDVTAFRVEVADESCRTCVEVVEGVHTTSLVTKTPVGREWDGRWGGNEAVERGRAVVCMNQPTPLPESRSYLMTAVDWTFGIAIWSDSSSFLSTHYLPRIAVVIHTIRENAADRTFSHHAIPSHHVHQHNHTGTKHADYNLVSYMPSCSDIALPYLHYTPPLALSTTKPLLSSICHMRVPPNHHCRHRPTCTTPLTNPPRTHLDPQSCSLPSPLAAP